LKAQGPQGCSQRVIERPTDPGEIQFAEKHGHLLDVGPCRLPITKFLSDFCYLEYALTESGFRSLFLMNENSLSTGAS
jgi:hypothetical protein